MNSIDRLSASGYGTFNARYIPGRVQGLSGVAVVSAGFLYSMAITQDGRARAWGSGVYGQLGDGTNAVHTMPVPVAGPGEMG